MHSLSKTQQARRLRRVTVLSGALFFSVYGLLLYISNVLGHIDWTEYNRVWLSQNTDQLNRFYSHMKNMGTFQYYRLGHMIDLGFPILYTLFFYSSNQLLHHSVRKGSVLYKISGVFRILILILPLIDWFETGVLHLSILTFPDFPVWIMPAHVTGKMIAALLFYPLIGWLLFILARSIIKRITGKIKSS